jgi:chromosome segregation ATPase
MDGGIKMSEEMTERFNSSDSFETRVLTVLAAINGQLGSINVRLTALEEKVGAIDARLTAVEQKVGAIEVRLGGLEKKVDALDQKVDALEEKVDARLRETRPIWEGVLARLDRMDAKFDVFAREMLEMRADIVLLQKRQPPAV